MADRYYPKNQRFYGLYTQGKEYMKAVDNEEYIGPYHYFGEKELVMTGAFPRDDSEVLKDFKQRLRHPDIFAYDQLTDLNLYEFKTPRAKNPRPGPNDIANGYMVRYFIKVVNDETAPVMEIDLKQYEDVIDSDGNNIDGFRYETISLRWKISGPRNDTYHDKEKTSIHAYGVEDTNRRTIYEKNKTMPGIIDALRDLTEHSQYNQIKSEAGAATQVSNLETDGTEFVLPDGTPYIGFYHIHATMGPMRGKRHSDKVAHEKLMTPGEYATQQLMLSKSY